jgi:CIC family chloride channel protein
MEKNETAKYKTLGLLNFSLLSVLIGVIAGLGAAVFRGLIALFHNLLFLGKLSLVYDANAHTPPSPWGPFVILVPVVGALAVAFLVKNFAPEAKGHGVPEVMDAIYYNKGVIRPVVAVIKSVASALSIGSGGAIGREGPIIQIGSSFGSSVGQLLKMPVWQRITSIAAGAGGGIAATFNTPIGGVLFAVEIMMHEVSARTLIPVAISTATATYLGRLFFGPYPSFVIPSFQAPYFHLTHPLVLPSYVVLGLIMGVFSALFIRSIYAFEDFFDKRVRGNYYTRHMSGMFVVGIIMYVLFTTQGHYYIEGVGYSTVQTILTGALSNPSLILILFALKLLATSLTLGSGASGGIFSPALFMGAALGGTYGIILHQFLPELAISPPAFAVAGMAGMVGGATGAAMAAIVMIFEMTLDYNVIIPMTITVALSYGVRKSLCNESIYTLKLVRRGHYMPEALQTHFHQLKRAKDIMDTRIGAVRSSSSFGEFARIVQEQEYSCLFLMEDEDRVIGVLPREMAIRCMGQDAKTGNVCEIAGNDFVSVSGEATLFYVLARMRSEKASVALVTKGGGGNVVSHGDVKGVITRRQIGEAMMEGIELFAG